MSKKKKRFSFTSSPTSVAATGDHETEYKIIKSDLLKVLAVNLIFLALVLGVYFTNSQSHYLEIWFDKLIKF